MAIELTSTLREQIENTLRCLTIDAVQRAGIGHVGAPMGLARPAFELWDQHLRFDPTDPRWPLRDRFVLSNGHASMLLYGLLNLFEFDLPMSEIERFRQLGSRTPGHPEYGETPGVEMTTGPLGQGFAHGVGMALGGRLTRSRYGDAGASAEGPGNHFVYGIVSDGDLMEGVSSEAGSFAGAHGLGNLIYLFDDNRITIDGGTDLTFREDVAKRFESHGWHVGAVDGEDHEGLSAALAAAREDTDRPSLIITRTLIGHGSPNFAGKSKAHGGPLGEDENRATKEQLGWPVDSELLVPDEVRAYCAERAEAKRQERQAQDASFEGWRSQNAERASGWDAALEHKLPPNLGEILCEGMEGVSSATRKHSGVVLERLWDHVPNLVGGSADLAGSAAPPIIKKAGIIGHGAGEGDPFAGGNVHFGVREHGMAAIANGIALDGTFIPYCGTFMIFSDYMRPAIRLAALMGVRSIFVFTHDSIFVGEDGPTHQPVEQLDSLRAVPNFPVFRPADGIETAMAYTWILECAQGPAMLALTRQGLPALERQAPFERRDVWKGGYIVRETEGKPDVVLVASGSEVPLAMAAAEQLAGQGTAARVVSLPCLELFLEQSVAYQDAVVPDDGTPLVGIEAARGESLRAVVGRRGLVYGMKGFGASAPWQDLATHFGFTPDALSAAVQEHLASR